MTTLHHSGRTFAPLTKAAMTVILFIGVGLNGCQLANANDTASLQCVVTPDHVVVGNSQLSVRFDRNANSLSFDRLDGAQTNTLGASTQTVHGSLLAADQDGHPEALEIRTIGACQFNEVPQGLGNQSHPRETSITINGAIGSTDVITTISARSDEPLIRIHHVLNASADTQFTKIKLVEFNVTNAEIIGTTQGVPVKLGRFIAMIEHPMAEFSFASSHLTGFIRRAIPLRAHTPVDYTVSLLDSADHSPRRAFLEYLERHRAHPYHSFLHYNSWYDIGYFTRYTEQDALNAIHDIGEPLKQRHVSLDSFLFDDGWDDPQHLWAFNQQFPNGFAHLKAATAQYGGAPGIWLSPWGGYGPPRQQRLKAAEAAGYEVDSQGLALSGPRYYAMFHERLTQLLATENINHLKLDGTGSPDKVTPHSEFDSDFAAARALIHDLRQQKPEIYINLTTGTWPSPFWLLDVDSIWRGGEDHSFLGTGSDRQRWITYRDADTYGGIVRISPWYPLNALMLHGIIFAQHAKGLDTATDRDFADDVWAYFSSGTGLQELYITGHLLNEHQWDTLARAARWAKDHQSALKDAHWIGGDPARNQIYGHAGFNDGFGYIAVRNPSEHAQSIALKPSDSLDLDPPVRCLEVSPVATDGNSTRVTDSTPRTPVNPKAPYVLALKPFELRVIEWRVCRGEKS